MQTVVKIGKRWYAVPRQKSLTDQIAERTVCTGNWQQIMQSQTNARVITNHKRK